jgi:hypothetical protein
MVPMEDGRIERLSLRRILLFRQIGVGAVIEEQLHDVHAPDCGGI